VKIVVTGAAGFIGSHTSEELVARGHTVVGVDSFDDYLYPAPPKRANAKHLTATLPADAFTLIEGNICDEQTIATAITDDVDAVCHLAALAGVRPSLQQPLKYIQTNLHGTGLIFERCRELGIKRVAFASSSSVYGVQAADGADLTKVAAFREDDPCLAPASPYAMTKRAGELLCSTYRDLYGIGFSALRFFTVYGPRQRPDMAIHKFVKLISSGQPITLFGDGTSRRDYTFVKDIVAGTVAACERVHPGSFNVYNLGNTQTIGLRELVATIEDVLGVEAAIEWKPMQPGDVPITFADITNAKRDLDYQPTTDMRAGVASFWQWYQQQKA